MSSSIPQENFRYYGGKSSGPTFRTRTERYLFLFQRLFLMTKREEDVYQYKGHLEVGALDIRPTVLSLIFNLCVNWELEVTDSLFQIYNRSTFWMESVQGVELTQQFAPPPKPTPQYDFDKHLHSSLPINLLFLLLSPDEGYSADWENRKGTKLISDTTGVQWQDLHFPGETVVKYTLATVVLAYLMSMFVDAYNTIT